MTCQRENVTSGCLSKADYSIQQQNVKISIPTIESIATSSSTVKTDVHILPLSLENNATLQAQVQFLINSLKSLISPINWAIWKHYHLTTGARISVSNKLGSM